jgi:hypothetical protein
MDRMNDDRHLTKDEMAVALVDRSDLPETRRSHLSRCRSCQVDVAAMTRQFDAMGEAARQMIPPPRALPRLPAAKSSSRPLLRRRALHGWGLAAVVLLALTFYLETPDLFFPVKIEPDRFAETGDNGQLMAEVALLVENALPQEYIDLAGTAETAVDEGFLEFLFPLPKTNSISEMLRFKGAVT